LNMQIVALLSLFFAVAAAKPNSNELNDYTFDRFVSDFGLKYEQSEIESRRAIFTQELTRVRNHNSKNLSWKESITKFSAMTQAEKNVVNGRSKRHVALQEKLLKFSRDLPASLKLKPVGELPESVDWRDAGVVSAVKDQGSCGSCWAFAATATLESHVAIQTGLLFDLSVQQMAMCAPNPDKCGGTGACQGSTAELAFEYVTGSRGMYQEYQYGYTSYYGRNADCKEHPGATLPVATIDGYIQLPGNNYTAVMNAIAQVGPVAINIDASTWHSYESGVFNGCNQATPDVNHVVVAVGYGVDADTKEKYWLVRNSWNPNFGEFGYIRLLRTDDDESNCGTDVTPQDGVACEDQKDVPVKVCGTCGAIYDVSYPINAKAL